MLFGEMIDKSGFPNSLKLSGFCSDGFTYMNLPYCGPKELCTALVGVIFLLKSYPIPGFISFTGATCGCLKHGVAPLSPLY